MMNWRTTLVTGNINNSVQKEDCVYLSMLAALRQDKGYAMRHHKHLKTESA